jgi:hypothetical protein
MLLGSAQKASPRFPHSTCRFMEQIAIESIYRTENYSLLQEYNVHLNQMQETPWQASMFQEALSKHDVSVVDTAHGRANLASACSKAHMIKAHPLQAGTSCSVSFCRKEQSRADQRRAKQSRTKQSRTIQSRAEQSKAEQSRASKRFLRGFKAAPRRES